MPRFIGVDLAWRSDTNLSGGVAMQGNRSGAERIDSTGGLRSLDDVLAFIDKHTVTETVIAIDAPLIIPNERGQRACETALSKEFGARHASCHSTNTRRYPDASSVRLEQALAARGFAHVTIGQRTQIEVYPHAALVSLFDLPTIIRYKKGPVGAKRSGLRELQLRIRSLDAAEARLLSASFDEILTRDLNRLRGRDLKAAEDELDALICAYSAYHHWYWRGRASALYGTTEHGYIVVPHTPGPR